MSIKVIIDQNNDILYNRLSNISLHDGEKLELVRITKDKLSSLIGKINSREHLIILDPNTSVLFCTNMLKNLFNQIDKVDIIIFVIDFKSVTNIINQEKHYSLFRKKKSNSSVFDIINIIKNSLSDTLEIEKNIDSILYKLGFTSYLKGTIYLRDAILLTYNNNELIQDMNILVKKVAEKNNVENIKVVRSAMDKSLNSVLDYLNTNIIYDVFKDDYDGRKISVKYFIDLCIRYLKKQKYCCLSQIGAE